jgi:hypothetical protein
MNEIILAKNRHDVIFFKAVELKGHKCADVRCFVQRGGEWIATRKGLTIQQSLLPDFIAKCQELQAQIEYEKLTPEQRQTQILRGIQSRIDSVTKNVEGRQA